MIILTCMLSENWVPMVWEYVHLTGVAPILLSQYSTTCTQPS